MNSEQNSSSTALSAPEQRAAGNLPAIPDSEPRQVPALFGEHIELAATNFQGTRAEVFQFVMECKNAPCTPLVDVAGQEIDVEYFFAHAVELVDERGQVDDAVRCVLVSPDGKQYQAVSQGVFDFLRSAAAAFGLDKFDPALRVKVEERRTRRGFRVLTLTPVAASGKRKR